jgi:replication factor C small subunit
MENAMWSEKYRPATLAEMIDQTEIIGRLKRFAETKTMPHCLFAGPPGSGKTTAALCLAHDLFGERFMDAFMELNASDARGIDVIRTTVKEFARIATISEVPFKILVLDEADNMTADAQHALRRTMERYTDTCRFVLSCNYSGKIIEPIQSRCAIFRFVPLGGEHVARYLKMIAEKEHVRLDSHGLQALTEASEGDLRRAVNTLQGAASAGKSIDEKTVYEIVGKAKPGDIQDLLEIATKGDFIKAREKLRSMLIQQGLSGKDILRQIHSEVLRMPIAEKHKIELVDAIGEIDYRLVQGADEEVQLSSLLARLGLTSSQKHSS